MTECEHPLIAKKTTELQFGRKRLYTMTFIVNVWQKYCVYTINNRQLFHNWHLPTERHIISFYSSLCKKYISTTELGTILYLQMKDITCCHCQKWHICPYGGTISYHQMWSDTVWAHCKQGNLHDVWMAFKSNILLYLVIMCLWAAHKALFLHNYLASYKYMLNQCSATFFLPSVIHCVCWK